MHGDHGETEGGSATNVANVALVRRTVRAIDASAAQDVDLLMKDLLCAAWPTLRARSQ